MTNKDPYSGNGQLTRDDSLPQFNRTLHRIKPTASHLPPALNHSTQEKVMSSYVSNPTRLLFADAIIWSAVLFWGTSQVNAQTTQAANGQSATSDEAIGFDRVREILRKRCVTCHNIDEMRGDLNLADLNGILAGSASGPVVMAGQPNQSLLYKTAAHLEDPVMPPNSPPIPARELDLLRRWIEGGCLESGAAMETKTPSPATSLAVPATNADLAGMERRQAKSDFVEIAPVFRAAAIQALAGHPTQPLAAVAGNQQIVLIDTLNGNLIQALDYPEGEVTALQFSRDGKWLIAAGGVAGLTGRVIGFDLQTGQRVFELADENDTILGLDISPDNKTIALGGPAKVVRVLRIEDGMVLHTMRKHTDWVLTLRFSPDGLLLASGDRFGGLFVWNSKTGEEFHGLRGHVGSVNEVDWDANSETLISGGEDAQVRTWNMHHGKLTSSWDGGVGAILDLESRNGKLAVAGRTNAFATWHGPELLLGRYQVADQVESIAFSGGTDQLVAGDALGNLHLLDKDAWKEIRQLQLPEEDRVRTEFYARLKSAVGNYEIGLVNKDVAKPSPVLLPDDQSAGVAPKLPISSESQATLDKADSGTADQHRTLRNLEERLAVLNASKLELDQMAKSTEESMQAMVAALANLHLLQQKLEAHRQTQGRLLEALEAERANSFTTKSTNRDE